ncbi:MAG: hypothetical protein ACKO3M_13265 [Rubrivivax sp.]
MRFRRAGMLALVAAVSVLHALLLPALWPARLGEGVAPDGRPARLAVQFAQVLQPSEPAPAPRRLTPGVGRVAAAVPGLAASAATADMLPALAAGALPELPPLPGPALPETAAPTSAAATTTPDATAFDWPPSTRLSYRVVGDVQGPVEGRAQDLSRPASSISMSLRWALFRWTLRFLR